MNIFRKFHYNAPVILSFTLLSMASLLLGMATQGETTKLLFSIYQSPMNTPLFYCRMLGHILGHINIQHFFNNFVIILLIGPILEEKYGSLRILTMILITALITGLLNIIFFETALLGASGIAFMFIILGSFVNLQKGRVPLTFILVVAIFVGKEVVEGVYAADQISHVTHITGGACGAVLGFFMNRSNDKKETAALAAIAEVMSEKEPEKADTTIE